MSEKTKQQTLKDIISNFTHAMLITHTLDGKHMNSRPMMIADVTEEGKMRFISHIDSEKIDELLRHPQVCITMQDGAKSASMGGTAVVRQGDETLKKIWGPRFEAWLEAPESQNTVLIEVHPEVGEYWNLTPGSVFNLLFDEAKAFFTNEDINWQDRTHGRVDFKTGAAAE